jgi:hypothetical protein
MQKLEKGAAGSDDDYKTRARDFVSFYIATSSIAAT